jgi:hypothetical protein
MKIAKEDLLRVRELCASKGTEMTPGQLEEILQQVKPDLTVIEEPGLVSIIKDIKDS